MDPCPCGSRHPYAACCQPLINGDKHAETAEELMRSRYSAHAQKAFDYLFDTTWPVNRQAEDRRGTAEWSRKLDWQRLEIRNVEAGGPDDEKGFVEFVARYRKNAKAFDHHEIAEFVRREGRWYFKDGHAPRQAQSVRQGPKVGRNDPCPCGSGKKYKKCCGR